MGSSEAAERRLASSIGPSGDRAYNASRRDPSPSPDLVLFSRPGCGLCDETRAALEGLLADRSARGLPVARLVERDARAPDDDWQRRYAFTIPVVELGERRLELAASPARLRRLLEDGLDAPGGRRKSRNYQRSWPPSSPALMSFLSPCVLPLVPAYLGPL